MSEPLTPEEQRGLVIISVLINFVDWLDDLGIVRLSEHERGDLVKDFLATHQEGGNYFMQAEQVAERLGEPFPREQ